ncbi:MAG: hypothetical protein PHY77_04905, partial [Desulfotomaculaceae bacterium]|nr:hypothetical protein [Desulfotomaculaceae bacterium]
HAKEARSPCATAQSLPSYSFNGATGPEYWNLPPDSSKASFGNLIRRLTPTGDSLKNYAAYCSSSLL